MKKQTVLTTTILTATAISLLVVVTQKKQTTTQQATTAIVDTVKVEDTTTDLVESERKLPNRKRMVSFVLKFKMLALVVDC